LLLAISVSFGCENRDSSRPSGIPAFESERERIEGIVLDAREAPSDSALLAIRDLGATHFALVSFGFMSDEREPEIRFAPDVRWFSESAEGTKHLAEQARELGMGIIIKPQIWIRGGKWTADLDFDSEEKWIEWQDDYRDYLIHTATLAEEVAAEVLIIGTELGNPVRERPEFFRSLIRDVRMVFSGNLSYGANWHEDYEQVTFWEDLDYIGVQAYFPISDSEKPEPEELREGWSSHIRDLEAVSTRAGLPILFTEIGYRSVHYAASEPWRWPSRFERVDPDFPLQAELFSAFFESVWEQPWFGGAILWKLYPGSARRSHDLDFTPQGKPAELVIRRWFGG
jgi:hypothetical protein